MCLYPKLIFNQKYKSNKKNGGIIPAVNDNRTLYVPVGCGNCIECRKQQSRQWQVRLSEEIRYQKHKHMVTLTFDNYNLELLRNEVMKSGLYHKLEENEIAKLGVRRFLERWRKQYGKSIRHWLCTELGHNGTERIHLHGIIFTDKPSMIEKIWQYGYVYIGQYVNEKTINYIVKYITKIDKDHKGYKAKILTSAGIGSNYLTRTDSKNNKYNNENTNETYKTRTGLKLNLPIYYRNKLYSEEQREKLWLNKLDKQERWIMGEKIDISYSEEEYESTLKFYQRKNKLLGYGDNSEEWSIKEYKKMRRRLKKGLNERWTSNKRKA
jgi:hypothetical protein